MNDFFSGQEWLSTIFSITVGIAVVAGFSLLIYFTLSLPLRRLERARFFVDLLETGLDQGRSIEDTIVSIARTKDKSVGKRFFQIGDDVERGNSAPEAMAKAGGLLPKQLRSMLAVGWKIGDYRRVLPVCRRYLEDGKSRVESTISYMMLFCTTFSPIILITTLLMALAVWPKIREIMFDFHVEPDPFMSWVFDSSLLIVLPVSAVSALLFILIVFYIGVPQLSSKTQGWWHGLISSLAYLIPWRRKRLYRDFSSLLAMLLDAGVSEEESIRLAAEGVANSKIQFVAEKTSSGLSSGKNLPEALSSAMPWDGGLTWRLRNAGYAGASFSDSLRSWWEMLDAEAFRLEQSFSHYVTTMLVIFNGVVVAMIASAVFKFLVRIVETEI
ncbi:MAG TPA: hypothetical protein EYQ50_09685 [Verrucomicrobiales bacterium]|nr:hypothetical protein [Verrucomicrobiales bacterium]HIL71075.1 hypothetical protein [Verrucomicrobiota bacterium]